MLIALYKDTEMSLRIKVINKFRNSRMVRSVEQNNKQVSLTLSGMCRNTSKAVSPGWNL